MIRACVIPLLVLVSGSATAQEKPTPEQMKAMMEKTLPGPPHQELAALEGRWTQEVIIFRFPNVPDLKIAEAVHRRMK